MSEIVETPNVNGNSSGAPTADAKVVKQSKNPQRGGGKVI